MIESEIFGVRVSWVIAFCFIGVASYSLSRTVADFRRRKFLVGGVGALCSVFLIVAVVAAMANAI